MGRRAEAASRFSRVHTKEFGGSPAGQILGSVDRVKPARQVVLDMVEGWIDTMASLNELADRAEQG